jgi:REP element-mobilizing transposase RayT
VCVDAIDELMPPSRIASGQDPLTDGLRNVTAKIKMKAAKDSRGSVQTELDLRRRTWGGARPNAGRKKIDHAHDPQHLRRPEVREDVPLHVVLRTLPGVPRLRTNAMYGAIHGALEYALSLAVGEFRIVHTSIQSNHLHFIIEAGMKESLSNGMQRVAIVAARAINRVARRSGKVFAFRYHSTRITTPRQMRNTLAYVLNNWRHHDEDRGRDKLDRYSTAIWFRHWRGVGRFSMPKDFDPLPSANPTSWLLTTGWLKWGELDPFERPKSSRN